MRKLVWFGPVLALLLITACEGVLSPNQGGGADPGDKAARVVSGVSGKYLLPYSPYNYQVQLAKFVAADSNGNSQVIGADRKLNATVWNFTGSQISNRKHANDAADAPATYTTTGTLKSVWDGYTLYLAVEVNDTSVSNLAALQSTTERMTLVADNQWGNFDAVEFDIDFFNDKIDKWELDDGMIKVSRNGKLAGHPLNGSDATGGTWFDPFSDPRAREFTDRLKDWNAYEKDGGSGYIAWLALEIYEGADPQNGMAFGIDVMIQDSSTDNGFRNGRTYWSHYDNSYRFNSMDGNLDWGCIVLDGHTGNNNSNFAKSDWMLTNPIRWAKGERWANDGSGGWWPPTGADYLINLPDSVSASWIGTSWTGLQNTINAGKAKLTQLDTWNRPHVDWSTTTQAEVKNLANAIESAIVNLRWVDDKLGATELDAPVTNTLPDPLQFKTNGDITPTETIPGMSAKKGTQVQSEADWKLRVREIKALASLYEYGPIPQGPKDNNFSVTIQSTPAVPAHWEHPGWWIVGGQPSKVSEKQAAYALTATYTYDGTEWASWDGTANTRISGLTANTNSGQPQTDSYTIYLPTPEQKAANGISGSSPVILSFSGNYQTYLQKGIAAIVINPNAVTTDARENTVWYQRGGSFRKFWPYNGRGKRYEFSNEMGAAWGASRAIDALVKAGEMNLIQTPITISGYQSSADFRLGDRLSADGKTWWTVGQISGQETPQGQLGTGQIAMLYLEEGATPPTTGGNPVTFNQFLAIKGNGVYEPANRGSASANISVGTPSSTGQKLKDIVDPTKLATDGMSINGKYAFVSAVFDDRIKLSIPAASGATGTQPWRYDARGNEYSWGGPGGAELIADNVLHNPGRANEVFRRFLSHFRWYQPRRGIDANGDISHGFAERLPFDNHELVASLYPRAIIEDNTFNDYNDGSEADAISMQAARMVYRFLIDKGFGEHKTPTSATASAEDLIKFNYRATGGHGQDPIQLEREAVYMAWYFYGKAINATFDKHLNTDPFFNDRLVPNGSNSYERHYGGFSVMMPWPWAGPYYPK